MLRIPAGLFLLLTFAFGEPMAPGTYLGKWEGGGGGGDFKVTLKKDSGDWAGDVSFSMAGQEVKCKVKSIKVDGAKLEMVYTFDLQGTTLQSAIDGELNSGKLAGKYKTTSGESAVDEGTFSASSGASK